MSSVASSVTGGIVMPDKMRGSAVVGRRRDFAPVDVEQVSLVHGLPFSQFSWDPCPYPRARIRRPFSRPQSRFFSVSRLSCSFLPLATASSSLARPRSLK